MRLILRCRGRESLHDKINRFGWDCKSEARVATDYFRPLACSDSVRTHLQYDVRYGTQSLSHSAPYVCTLVVQKDRD